MGIFNPVETNLISKMTVGGQTYYLKDAEVRELLAKLNDAALKNVAAGISADEQGLVTGAQVQAALNMVTGAMQFVGKYDSLEAAGESGKSFKDGDIILVGVKEYIYFENKWNELGDEGIYALKSTTIAGLSLEANITVDALQNALGLGALAYKSEAKGTVPAQTVTGVKATGNSTGSIDVVLDHNKTAVELEKADYTPEGSVTGHTTAAGSVSLAASEAEGAFQITGTVAAPTVTVTPAVAEVQHIDSVGTKAEYTEGAFSAGSLPTFVQGSKASWSASVDDNETLSFAFAANGDDTFNQGTLPSKERDTFVANELPTKAPMNVVTGITEAKATAPVFTGGKIAAEFSGTQADIVASFAGTKAEKALVASAQYEKAAVNAEGTKFNSAPIELAVGDIEVASKEVTVK